MPPLRVRRSAVPQLRGSRRSDDEELTPSEAAELTRLVESFARVLETVDHEERLRALDGQWQTIAGAWIASRSGAPQGKSSFGTIIRLDA